MIITKDGFEIYNAHPCGCWDIETKQGMQSNLCKNWSNCLMGRSYEHCWSIIPHTCWKMESHK